jgi:hypothetical protein
MSAAADATSEALTVLDDFWGAYEIGGVALVDMRVWRWMYAHPDATPAELRDATLGIARQVEQQIARSGNLGGEFERMTRQGRVTPHLWIQKATGAPVAPAALIEAAERALEQLR